MIGLLFAAGFGGEVLAEPLGEVALVGGLALVCWGGAALATLAGAAVELFGGTTAADAVFPLAALFTVLGGVLFGAAGCEDLSV